MLIILKATRNSCFFVLYKISLVVTFICCIFVEDKIITL